MSAIADLAERTGSSRASTRSRASSGSARAPAPPYLALELVDPSGRIEGRVWNDVELLDGRFAEGDAVRVLGRVERFDDRLQLEIRSVEPAEGLDPADLAPRLRRDADELDGFLEFLAGEISHPGLEAVVAPFLDDCELRGAAARAAGHRGVHHDYAGGLLEHTVGVATLCRETAQLHPRLRPTCCSPRRSSTTSAGRSS